MKKFKNTFAPNCRTKELTPYQIIRLLFHRVVLYKDLPTEVKHAADEYQAIHAKKSSNTK